MSYEQKYKHSRLLVVMALLAGVTIAWWSYTAPSFVTNAAAEATSQKEQVATAQTAATTVRPSKTASGAYIVRYTNDGFEPFITEIFRGETIQFQNESSRALWVTTKNHPTAKQQQLDELDFERSLQIGQTYEYTANKVGVWGFYNLNDRSHLGTLVVKP